MNREYRRILADESLHLMGILEGYCPVQAEGTVASHPFYFHARWHEWSFSVAETTGVSAVDMSSMLQAETFGFQVTEQQQKPMMRAGWSLIKRKESSNSVAGSIWS
ncbi:hypothetical protein [Hymenobacter metallilatus]|uniref:Uncharacterized protein n=1 Tax=Hymenobacter metallilatus TaxID=2493666 RepID=A0A428JDM9_9BACT|nr:hypothetical protein [Hymenobacter metallilatus]RSK30230.1 hypothetical protein EI290_15385 [Hymenobacter metallilatus]